MRWSRDDSAWDRFPIRRGVCELAAAFVVGGAGLVGGAISAGASKSAANTQAQAADRAAQVQQNMFDTTRADLNPFISGGQNGLAILMKQLGITPATADVTNPDGTITKGTPAQFDPNAPLVAQQGQFDPGMGKFNFDAFKNGQGPLNLSAFNFDPNNLENTPGYQFQLKQGLDAVQHQGARGGGALGGNSLRAMQDYAQGLAGTTYQQQFGNALSSYNANTDSAFKNYTTNFDTSLAGYGTNQNNALQNFQTNYNTGLSTFNTNAGVTQQNKSNIFDMINSLLQTGQTSAAGAGNIGATTGANIGNAYMQAGNASAAGTVGAANAISGGINNASQMYLLSKMFA